MTLSELLVSISVVAVLMAILLPALAMFRESARKAACANNISRIAKGFTAYETAQSQIPGWRNALEPYTTANTPRHGKPNTTSACVSWAVTVMPYIGQREIADWYANYPAEGIEDPRTKRVNLYVCPLVTDEMKTGSPLCYFVNGGTGAMALNGQYQYTGDGVCLDAAGNLPTQVWYETAGGADVYYPGRYSFADIAEGDGNSNTLLLAERTGPLSPTDVSWADNPVAPTNGADKAAQTAHAILHTRGIHPGYGAPGGGQSAHATENTWMKTRGDNALRYPSSRHEGGFMTAFCDGHIRFVSDSIDEWVYTQVLTSDRRHLSLRVAMFQQRPTAVEGVLEPYVFDEHDLDGP